MASSILNGVRGGNGHSDGTGLTIRVGVRDFCRETCLCDGGGNIVGEVGPHGRGPHGGTIPT